MSTTDKFPHCVGVFPFATTRKPKANLFEWIDTRQHHERVLVIAFVHCGSGGCTHKPICSLGKLGKTQKDSAKKNRIRLVTPQVLHQLTQHANGEPQGASRVLSLHTVHVYTRKVLFIYFPFSPTLRRPLTSASRHTPVQNPPPPTTTTTTQAWRTVSFGAYDWGHGALSATLAHTGLSGAPPLLSIYLVILSPKTWTSAKKTTEKKLRAISSFMQISKLSMNQKRTEMLFAIESARLAGQNVLRSSFALVNWFASTFLTDWCTKTQAEAEKLSHSFSFDVRTVGESGWNKTFRLKVSRTAWDGKPFSLALETCPSGNHVTQDGILGDVYTWISRFDVRPGKSKFSLALIKLQGLNF